MKSILPASHLLKQFVLFILTMIFLLTVTRAALALWQFQKLENTGVVVDLFVLGLRYDLALIGLICLIPIVLGSLFSMTDVTRAVARFVIVLFLVAGLVFTLLLELVTPWFIQTQGIRPDFNVITGVEQPAAALRSVISQHAISLIIGLVLCVLITFAFWSRLELQRFLKYRLSVPSAMLLALVGGLVCLVAVWSTPDLRKAALGPANSSISDDSTINEITMNSAYKTVYSLVMPYLTMTKLTAESNP